MQTLVRGVTVYQQQHDDQRVTLSAGTQHPADTSHQAFTESARIPVGPWQQLTPVKAELLLIAERTAFRMESSVAVITLPAALVERFTTITAMTPDFERPSGQFALQPDQSTLLDDMRAYAMQCCVRQDSLNVGPIVASLPGLMTKTFNRQLGRFIGLHLDSWDNDPLARRADSTNRLCVNLGPDERTFHFLNLTVQQIADALYAVAEQAQWHDQPPHMHRIGHEFMAKFPDYPIVSVVVRPGEAYIAPTENVFHDGATIESDHLNFTFTLRGYFAPPSQA